MPYACTCKDNLQRQIQTENNTDCDQKLYLMFGFHALSGDIIQDVATTSSAILQPWIAVLDDNTMK